MKPFHIVLTILLLATLLLGAWLKIHPEASLIQHMTPEPPSFEFDIEQTDYFYIFRPGKSARLTYEKHDEAWMMSKTTPIQAKSHIIKIFMEHFSKHEPLYRVTGDKYVHEYGLYFRESYVLSWKTLGGQEKTIFIQDQDAKQDEIIFREKDSQDIYSLRTGAMKYLRALVEDSYYFTDRSMLVQGPEKLKGIIVREKKVEGFEEVFGIVRSSEKEFSSDWKYLSKKDFVPSPKKMEKVLGILNSLDFKHVIDYPNLEALLEQAFVEIDFLYHDETLEQWKIVPLQEKYYVSKDGGKMLYELYSYQLEDLLVSDEDVLSDNPLQIDFSKAESAALILPDGFRVERQEEIMSFLKEMEVTEIDTLSAADLSVLPASFNIALKFDENAEMKILVYQLRDQLIKIAQEGGEVLLTLSPGSGQALQNIRMLKSK